MLPISYKTIWAGFANAWDVRDRRVGYVIGTGASTSMAPSAHGAASLQVDVAAGNYSKNGADSSTAYAGGSITLTAADGTNPRVDIVYMNSGGTLAKTDGTAAAIVVGVSGPVPPAWPAGCCPLAICLVPATATDFTTGGYVFDCRPFGVVPTSASGATPALTLGTANSAGVATTFIRTDDTILVFDATVPAAIGTAAAGAATTAPRRDHVHPTGASTPVTIAYANATGSGPAGAMTDHVHALAMTVTNDTLGSDVTFTGNNTWTDVLSRSLIAGTYTIIVSGHFDNQSVNPVNALRLQNTTDSASLASGAFGYNTAGGYVGQIPLVTTVTLVGTKTIKLQAITNGGGGTTATVRAATSIANATGNNATQMVVQRTA